jgi:FHA domain
VGVRETVGVEKPVKSTQQTKVASDIKAIIEAIRAGVPFVFWRDRSGTQHIVGLDNHERVTIGRGSSCDVVLMDDGEVSRAHADLHRIGGEWAVVDDGLSRNGTFLNGSRVSGRRRLADGDVMRLGTTVLEFRYPAKGSTIVTSAASNPPAIDTLSEVQRKILIALCRPFKGAAGFATPSTNKEIASEVFLGVDAVKMHLRILFKRFQISDLPRNQKRARLVECAFQWGLVSERDL